MKFLLITLGSIGDLLPFLAVADALRRRGHRVVLASSAAYAQLVSWDGRRRKSPYGIFARGAGKPEE